MRIEQGNSLLRVKAANQATILRLIYYLGPVKRADIAEQLELTLPTITTNVNSMISAGIVREVSVRDANQARIGRKARLLEVVPEAYHFIGIESTGTRRCVSVTDYCGRPLYSHYDEQVYADYRRSMEETCQVVMNCLKHCRLKLEDISGVCFGLPGWVDREEGVLRVHPRTQWSNKNICKDFQELTGYQGTVIVENNACVRAIGAQFRRRREMENVQSFAYLFVDTGIACPLIVNMANYLGSVVGAGEVGHMVMEANGRQCVCGNRGCLEAYSSDYAVIQRCEEALRQGKAAGLKELCGQMRPEMFQIMKAQRQGDKDVAAIVENAVKVLGTAVANIINFTCPEKILIDCKLFGLEKNRTLLLEQADRNLCNKTYRGSEFLFVEPDHTSGALGAAAVAINHALETHLTVE